MKLSILLVCLFLCAVTAVPVLQSTPNLMYDPTSMAGQLKVSQLSQLYPTEDEMKQIINELEYVMSIDTSTLTPQQRVEVEKKQQASVIDWMQLQEFLQGVEQEMVDQSINNKVLANVARSSAVRPRFEVSGLGHLGGFGGIGGFGRFGYPGFALGGIGFGRPLGFGFGGLGFGGGFGGYGLGGLGGWGLGYPGFGLYPGYGFGYPGVGVLPGIGLGWGGLGGYGLGGLGGLGFGRIGLGFW